MTQKVWQRLSRKSKPMPTAGTRSSLRRRHRLPATPLQGRAEVSARPAVGDGPIARLDHRMCSRDPFCGLLSGRAFVLSSGRPRWAAAGGDSQPGDEPQVFGVVLLDEVAAEQAAVPGVEVERDHPHVLGRLAGRLHVRDAKKEYKKQRESE